MTTARLRLGALRSLRQAAGFAASLLLVLLWSVPETGAATLPETIKKLKPGIVAVGTYQKTRRPPAALKGTGFAVGRGKHILTNAHVVDDRLDEENRERLAIFVGQGDSVEVRYATVLSRDAAHDVAVLGIEGNPLPVLKLGNDLSVEEGQSVAFTGFPVGPVFGLYPATHRGIVSAISPIALPQQSPRQLDVRMIKALRDRYDVFQLDATAYPGNSGSPLYDPSSGAVYGMISSVFVKETKEKVLSDPSGITYAIPIRHARRLLDELGVPN